MATTEQVGWIALSVLALFFLAQYVDARRITRTPAPLGATVKQMVMAVNAWIRDFLTLTRTTMLAFGLLGSIFFVFPHLVGLDPFAWAGALSFLLGMGAWFGVADVTPLEAVFIIGSVFIALWLVARAILSMPAPRKPSGRIRR